MDHYYAESKQTYIVPRKILDKLDEITIRGGERGAYNFFWDITHYIPQGGASQVNRNVLQRPTSFQTIKLKQLRLYIFCYVTGITVATVVLIAEFLIKNRHEIVKWKKNRKGKNHFDFDVSTS